jgi:4a-hydroxytetrahydrobiopterin dehydratase
MARLTAAALRSALTALPGWKSTKGAIHRTFTCASFPDAIAFATRIAFDAEAADHHPDILISYKKVTVTWSTHSEGGVTTKDISAAGATDRRYETAAK